MIPTLSERAHVCDRTCACPSCGRPMLYSRKYRTHRCGDFDCEASHGILPLETR